MISGKKLFLTAIQIHIPNQEAIRPEYDLLVAQPRLSHSQTDVQNHFQIEII